MLTKRRSLTLLGLALIGWVGVVVASGTGWNPFSQKWSFANTGAFGDSFGPLGAMMAALAAFAAFETLAEQRVELRRIRLKEAEEERRREKERKDQQRRQIIQDKSDRKSAFEETFFRLLDAFRDIAKDTDVGTGESRKVSRDAFQRICTSLVANYSPNKELERAWTNVVEHFKNDLNHYFRFMYHLVNFVDQQKQVDRYFYVRLIRATLSEAELILLFANCAVGEGREKFAPLIEKYALLHNVSDKSRKSWSMDKYFSGGAFEYDRGTSRA